MTATTTLTKTCIDCERPMRPANANPDYWPDDAVTIGNKGRCNSCTRRTYTRSLHPCTRCGTARLIRAGRKGSGLCRSCWTLTHTTGTAPAADTDLGLDPRGSWVPNGRGVLVWHGPETRTA